MDREIDYKYGFIVHLHLQSISQSFLSCTADKDLQVETSSLMIKICYILRSKSPLGKFVNM